MEFKNILHGGDYNPEQWIDNNNYKDIIDLDFTNLRERKINSLTVGVFSWAYYNPDEDVYNFDYLDYIINKANKEGVEIILSTPSGGFPNWLKIKYPEINRTNNENTVEGIGNRHNYCYSSPDTLREITKINTILAKRYKNNDITLWHISNEMDGQCFCKNCQKKFRKYLKNHFTSIEQLNNIWNMNFWSQRYDSFDQIMPPFSYGDESNPSLHLWWTRFISQNAIDIYNHETKAIKDIIPDAKTTTNLCYGVGHQFNYNKFAKNCDIVSWDSYHEWNKMDDDYHTACYAQFNFDIMRGFKQDNFLMMESTPNTANWRYASKNKRPGVHEATTMLSIACGNQMVGYFQMVRSRNHAEIFHSAILDYFISGDRIGKEVKQLGENLEKISEVLESTTISDVALIFDYEIRDIIDINIGPRKVGGMKYPEYVEEIHSKLMDLPINVDIVNLKNDLSKYKIIIIPMHFMIDKNDIEMLSKLNAQIIITGFTGLANYNNQLNFGGRDFELDNLVGNKIIEYEAIYDNDYATFKYNGRNYKTKLYHEYINVVNAEVLSTYTFDLYNHSPIVTRKDNVTYVGALVDPEFYRDYISNILDIEVKTQSYVMRTRENKKCIYSFYFNFSNEAVNLHHKGIDLVNGNEISDFILHKFDYKIIKTNK